MIHHMLDVHHHHLLGYLEIWDVALVNFVFLFHEDTFAVPKGYKFHELNSLITNKEEATTYPSSTFNNFCFGFFDFDIFEADYSIIQRYSPSMITQSICKELNLTIKADH